MACTVFCSVAPYHIISYGTLLGTTFFHSFISSPILFKTVDRPTFSLVQAKAFPIYFGMQTALSSILALTYPGNPATGVSTGLAGLMHESSRWHALAPIATMILSSLVNLTVLLPATSKVKKERQGQAKRDGKDWYAPGPHSAEMQALNKKFGLFHGCSSLLNLAVLVSSLAYGFTLGARI